MDPESWGSNLRAIFDDDGYLVRMERESTKEDDEVAASYLSYLENQFMEHNE